MTIGVCISGTPALHANSCSGTLFNVMDPDALGQSAREFPAKIKPRTGSELLFGEQSGLQVTGWIGPQQVTFELFGQLAFLKAKQIANGTFRHQ